MSAAEQREAFQSALSDALEDECSMEVVHFLHDYLREKIEDTPSDPKLLQTVWGVGYRLHTV